MKSNDLEIKLENTSKMIINNSNELYNKSQNLLIELNKLSNRVDNFLKKEHNLKK